jgi:cell division protein FtsL
MTNDKRRRGLRFSLLTLMVLTAIVAMAVGLIVSVRNNRRIN